MPKTKKRHAVIEIPEVNGAFVGNTLRPFTQEEFHKIKVLLAQKRRHKTAVKITDHDLRVAGLEHLVSESENGKTRK